MNENYLKVIELLGEAIINKDLKISVLEYENKKLEQKIKSIEEYVDYYANDCECVNRKIKEEIC